MSFGHEIAYSIDRYNAIHGHPPKKVQLAGSEWFRLLAWVEAETEAGFMRHQNAPSFRHDGIKIHGVPVEKL